MRRWTLLEFRKLSSRPFHHMTWTAWPLGGCLVGIWIPSRGHSGGILVGVKEDILQVENWDLGETFVGVTVRHRLSNFRWDVLVVYGPANHDFFY